MALLAKVSFMQASSLSFMMSPQVPRLGMFGVFATEVGQASDLRK